MNLRYTKILHVNFFTFLKEYYLHECLIIESWKNACFFLRIKIHARKLGYVRVYNKC